MPRRRLPKNLKLKHIRKLQLRKKSQYQALSHLSLKLQRRRQKLQEGEVDLRLLRRPKT